MNRCAAALGLMLLVLISAAQGEPQATVQWPSRAVAIEQWPSPTYQQLPPPGVVFLHTIAVEGPHTRYVSARHGSMAGDHCAVGLLNGVFTNAQRVELDQVGRTANRILLRLTLHPDGGQPAQDNLPDLAKTIAFAVDFPIDLPNGRYHFAVELRDPQGVLQQRHETAFDRTNQPHDHLSELSDEQLLAEYVRRAEALKGTAAAPVDGGHLGAAAISYEIKPRRDWEAAQHAIIERGQRMVPMLLAMLETEAVRNPPQKDAKNLTLGDDNWAAFGLASSLTFILQQIDDPRAAAPLVDILDGRDEQVNPSVQRAALQALTSVTRVGFLVDHAYGGVEHPNAISRPKPFEPGRRSDAQVYAQVAGLYRHWLSGEGADPARWQALAVERARTWIRNGTGEQVRKAIAFLNGMPCSHRVSDVDDQPQVTLDLLVRRLQDEPALCDLLGAFGPRARPHAAMLIAHAEDAPWQYAQALTRIGGQEMMASFIARLPALAAAAKAAEDRSARLSCDIARWGIERWAGRLFDDDEQIRKWWQAARSQAQRQWLEDGLEPTARRADAGDARAQYLLRQVLPDLPDVSSDDRSFTPPPTRVVFAPYREKPPAPFRLQWLREHRGRLQYDEAGGGFRLQDPAAE